MSPIISYLVPSYNHANYISLLLEGISEDIAALGLPAEVIIIDDGSKDNSPQGIKDWAERQAKSCKIRCFYQENQGLTATLNKLISLAQGDYLRLCASDDLISVGSTKQLYEPFLCQPQLVCVFADAQVINEQGKLIHKSSLAYHKARVKRLQNPALRTKELIEHWCVAGPSHLIKRSHYERLSYNESSSIDDYDLFLSLLDVPDSLLFINEIVCSYRIHSTNTSKTKDPRKRLANIHCFLDIINNHLNKANLRNYLSIVKYRSIAKIYFLEKRYLYSLFFLGISLILKAKSELSS